MTGNEPGPPRPAKAAPPAGPPPGSDTAVDEVHRQALALLRKLAAKRPWIKEALEDAASEVMLFLLDRGGDGVWDDLARRRFGTPESRRARQLLFRAIQTVSDRLRHRRRVEIRPGEPGYDAEVGKARRQRRTIPPDRPLAADSERIIAARAEDDLQLDIRDALQRLQPDQRDVVYGRVVRDQTWEALASDLRISVAQARGRFAAAVTSLGRWLEGYEDLA